MRALLVLVAVWFAPRPSDACSGRHITPYEMLDRATTVAYVRVLTVPKPKGNASTGDGDVQLEVTRVIKGAKANTLTAVENSTSCRIGFREGKTALVFLRDGGRTIGQFGYREEFKEWEPTIDAWAAASTEEAQRSVMVEAFTKGTHTIRHDTAMYLADAAHLLAGLDAEQKKLMLGVKEIANFPDLRWRLKGSKFERITDVKKLAALISARKGGDRIEALERCERVHAKTLWPFSSYRHETRDAAWKKLADACLTGTPLAR